MRDVIAIHATNCELRAIDSGVNGVRDIFSLLQVETTFSPRDFLETRRTTNDRQLCSRANQRVNRRYPAIKSEAEGARFAPGTFPHSLIRSLSRFLLDEIDL